MRLLDAGIDPAGFVDQRHRGPLHYLATVDGEAVLDRLLATGLDINARDRDGLTPLASALLGRAPAALIRAMLNAGADPLAVATADGHPAVRGVADHDLIPMVIEAARLGERSAVRRPARRDTP
jgi:ankyrin repeat protein